MSKSLEFHKLRHEHHHEQMEIEDGHAETHKAMTGEYDKDSAEHLHHKTKHDLHKRASAGHAKLAAYHLAECEKATLADGLSKAAPDTLQEMVKKMVAEEIGNTLVPTKASIIANPDLVGVRAIPRAGQKIVPAGAQAPSVPMEFVKLFSTEDNDPVRQ